MKFNRIKRRKSNSLILELTPLIDVVFLLLIFFMVATTFEDINTGIKIDLPSSSIKIEKPIVELKVTITKDKSYYIGYKSDNTQKNYEVKFDKLKEALSNELKKSENKNVVISADKSLSHGMIVNIMTIAKEAGALSLDIDTVATGK